MKRKDMLTGAICLGLFAASANARELETGKWQAEIDRVAAQGGGTVTLTPGRHLTGTLFLKSGVTLEIPKGAVLEGSTDITHYPDIKLEYAEIAEPWQAVVAAQGQERIAVVGEGTIYGNGNGFPMAVPFGRPRGMLFYRCRNVRVEGIRFYNMASWTCYFKECDGVVYRKVRVSSYANWNTDGVDIDAKNVLVEDCDIDSEDDAIVLKSDHPDFICENVEVRNCRIGTDCNLFKLGTASHGGFRNIYIHDCVGARASRQFDHPERVDLPKGGLSWREENWPGSPKEATPLGGVVIECVDGGLAENITVKNIEVKECCVPIFVRGGQRKTRGDGKGGHLPTPFGHHSILRNVTIENVKAKGLSYTASSITGVPGLTLKNITLRNIEIEVPGAGDAGLAEIGKPVPEKAADYPESCMFDSRMLPAYGFYLRHIDGLKMENVRVKVRGVERRPEIVSEDVTFLK